MPNVYIPETEKIKLVDPSMGTSGEEKNTTSQEK